MKKIIKLTERDLTRLVKRTINEMEDEMDYEMEDQDDDMVYIVIESWKMQINDDLQNVADKYIQKLEKMLESMNSSSKYSKKQKTDMKYEINSLIRTLEDTIIM